MAFAIASLPVRAATAARKSQRATRVAAKRFAVVASARPQQSAKMAAAAAAAAPLMFAGEAMAANVTATVAAAAEASPEDLQAFAVLLGGSAVIIVGVLSLVIGSDLFIKNGGSMFAKIK